MRVFLWNLAWDITHAFHFAARRLDMVVRDRASRAIMLERMRVDRDGLARGA